METSTTTVRPHPTLLGHVTKLSMIDQIAPRDYQASYFFFSLPADTDKLGLFRKIEHGFYTTVQQIPDLMCCICESDGDRDELELRLHGDSGATISMKDYTRTREGQWSPGTFGDLARDHFPLQRLPQEHVLAQTEFPGQVCVPTLAVQVNFIQGGLILTGCLHHTASDGASYVAFWSVLGQHISAATTGEAPDPLTDSAISFLADRKSVVTPETNVSLRDLPDWKLVQDHSTFLNPCDYDSTNNPPVHFATYFISEDKIRFLKQSQSTQSGKPPGATLAICAFLWKHIVNARGIDCARYPETKLSIAVNARPKMTDPACSPTYWGNMSEPNAVARMPTSAFCEAAAIKTPTTSMTESTTAKSQESALTSQDSTSSSQALATAAARIKQAIAAIDSTAVRRLVGLLNQMDKATSLTWNVDRWPGPDMLIVNLNAFKYNYIDFGPELGCSEAWRGSIGKPNGKPDGRCFLLPPRHSDGRGMEVSLQYDAETLQRLKNCAEFREFFDWRH